MSKSSRPIGQQSGASRRQFLRQAAAVGAGAVAAPIIFPTIVPSTALGKDGAVAANERIVMGGIGTGGRGRGHVGGFMSHPDVQWVAVCDVDARHLADSVAMVNERYANTDCKGYKDLRDLCARKDIDAVVVATPDHWHALATVAALKAGKDVYCEKPLCNSIYEGRKIVEAANANKRIVQTGSQERSGSNARYACELVLNGRLGKLQTMRINLPDVDPHHITCKEYKQLPPPENVPAGFDWDTWLGFTPKVPYSSKRTHFFWRFILDYGGGEMTDRGAHVIDIGQLGNGSDDTGPVEIQAKGEQTPGSVYDTFWNYEFTNKYANGVTLVGSTKEPRGIKFECADGWIFVEIHGGRLECSKPELITEEAKNKEIKANEIKLGRSPGHDRDFLNCCKSRKQPIAHAEIGHRTASVCHLNNISMRLGGKKLTWDPKAEKFTGAGADEANRFVKPVMRPPWVL